MHGSAYVVRGRVVGARIGRVELELDDGFRLAVETGSHKIRADIRDSTEVRGTLCFTPSGFSSDRHRVSRRTNFTFVSLLSRRFTSPTVV